MFRYFEDLIRPTAPVRDETPPSELVAFFWHFARQAKGVVALLLFGGLCTAALDLAIPGCIGRVAGLVSTRPRDTFLAEAWPELAGMAALVLLVRPCVLLFEFL